jgi:hypothetical protein
LFSTAARTPLVRDVSRSGCAARLALADVGKHNAAQSVSTPAQPWGTLAGGQYGGPQYGVNPYVSPYGTPYDMTVTIRPVAPNGKPILAAASSYGGGRLQPTAGEGASRHTHAGLPRQEPTTALTL